MDGVEALDNQHLLATLIRSNIRAIELPQGYSWLESCSTNSWSGVQIPLGEGTVGQGFKPNTRVGVPTCLIRVHLGVDILGLGQHEKSWAGKNHPTLTGQDTRGLGEIKVAQSVSHQQPPPTLPIIGRRRHMVARQLKFREGLIKPEPWRM